MGGRLLRGPLSPMEGVDPFHKWNVLLKEFIIVYVGGLYKNLLKGIQQKVWVRKREVRRKSLLRLNYKGERELIEGGPATGRCRGRERV